MNHPMSYMYQNNPYMMPMYQPYPTDQNSYENMEKYYKMQHQYYMQMSMQYPFPNPYSDSSRMPYPYSMYPTDPK